MSLLSSFHNDPFFSSVTLPHPLTLEHRSRSDHQDRQLVQRQENDKNDFDLFGNSVAFMQNMMNNMGQMVERKMNSSDLQRKHGQGISFSSSTVMSMDRRNGRRPRIFQAASEKLCGPEGLERTRKAVRDTSRNLEKMEIAHRLGERGHKVIQERDPVSGQVLENREFEHIDDENQFEHEWFSRAEQFGLKNLYGNRFNPRRNTLFMAPSASTSHRP